MSFFLLFLHGKHWYPAFWTPTTFRAMSGTMRIILDKLNVGETHWCLVIGHCFLSTSHSRKKCSMSHVAAFSVCFFWGGSATVYEVYEADVHLEFIAEKSCWLSHSYARRSVVKVHSYWMATSSMSFDLHIHMHGERLLKYIVLGWQPVVCPLACTFICTENRC